MAQLPSGEYLIQQIEGMVVLFHRYTEEELVRFDASNANTIAIAQKSIHELTQLSDEDKCFAHFWSGYFYAYSGGIL